MDFCLLCYCVGIGHLNRHFENLQMIRQLMFIVRFKLLPVFKIGRNNAGKFLDWYFYGGKSKLIVQVGANDGVQSDPLRKFLKEPGNYTAILIEPIPFYIAKLKSLYANRLDISIIQAACGEISCNRDLFFIDPAVADQMNGDGPQNNWAHGQGSFESGTIVHWINENKFRGEEYIKNIPFYISSIQSVELKIRRVSEFIPSHDNYLLMIDVQGFELDVLRGVDWSSNPPAYVVLEDDLGKFHQIDNFLNKKGYRYLCGDYDKVFQKVY